MGNLNVMLLGKTGVGKSSLLNYLAGKEVVETGIGKPVTKKGEFNEHQFSSDYLHLNIIDSWGLEVKEQNEWFKVIQTEVKRRDETINKDDNVHAFIYIVNMAGGRFEDKEEKIIQNILTQISSHIVIVLSNSQNITNEQYNDINERLIKIKSIVKDETKNDNINCEIIKVNSANDSEFSDEDETYGKDELLKALADIAWGSLVDFSLQESENQKVIISTLIDKLCINNIAEKASTWAFMATNDKSWFIKKKYGSEEIKSFYEQHLKRRIQNFLEHEVEQQIIEFNDNINNEIKKTYSKLLETYKKMNSNVKSNVFIDPHIETDVILEKTIEQGVLNYNHVNIEHKFFDTILSWFNLSNYEKDINKFIYDIRKDIELKILDLFDEYNRHIRNEIKQNITYKIINEMRKILLDNHPIKNLRNEHISNLLHLLKKETTSVNEYHIQSTHHIEIGLAHLNKNEYMMAIQAFSQAIDITPRNELAYQYRGVAYEYKEDYKNAIKDYDTVLYINPNNTHVYDRIFFINQRYKQ